MEEITIVLVTSGKRDAVDYVAVKLFTNRNDAEKYCFENTDNPKDEKYWRYCEIIEEGCTYEPSRYHNYT